MPCFKIHYRNWYDIPAKMSKWAADEKDAADKAKSAGVNKSKIISIEKEEITGLF